MAWSTSVGLIAPIANYVLCAVPFWWWERQRRLSPAVASWRTPLGLETGLFLHLAPGLIGALAGLGFAWLAFGSPRVLFAPPGSDWQGEAAALLGTLAGGLGGIAASGYAYRLRGAGRAAAGLIAVPLWRTLRTALRAALLLTVAAVLYHLVFSLVTGRAPELAGDPLIELTRDRASRRLWLTLLAVSAGLIAPIMEEVIYRGVIYRAFRDRGAPLQAMVGSGLLFSVSHFQPDFLLPLWLIGIVFAWLYERSGSLVTPIFAHAFYNLCALGLEAFAERCRGGRGRCRERRGAAA